MNSIRISTLDDENRPIDDAKEQMTNNIKTSLDINLSESHLVPQNTQGVIIKVSDPLTREGGFQKYVVYTIKGEDKNGQFQAIRRYNEFLLVRKWLVTKWPGCYVPPIPPKKKLGNLEAKFIEERRRFLERFCQKIADISYFYYSDEFQAFLRSSSTTDLEKAHPQFLKPDYGDIVSKYSNIFSYLGGKELNNQTMEKIKEFSLFLNRSYSFYKGYKEMAVRFTATKRAFYDQFHIFNNYLLSDYEKRVFIGYCDEEQKLVVTNPENQQVNSSVASIKQASNTRSVEYIEEWVRQERREVEAFIEAINQRNHYLGLKAKAEERVKSEEAELASLLAGKKTLKSFFNRGPKADQISSIEKTIEQTKSEIESINMLVDMIVLIISEFEIDKFKREKTERYYDILRRASGGELDNLREVVGYWELISKNNLVINSSRK